MFDDRDVGTRVPSARDIVISRIDNKLYDAIQRDHHAHYGDAGVPLAPLHELAGVYIKLKEEAIGVKTLVRFLHHLVGKETLEERALRENNGFASSLVHKAVEDKLELSHSTYERAVLGLLTVHEALKYSTCPITKTAVLRPMATLLSLAEDAINTLNPSSESERGETLARALKALSERKELTPYEPRVSALCSLISRKLEEEHEQRRLRANPEAHEESMAGALQMDRPPELHRVKALLRYELSHLLANRSQGLMLETVSGNSYLIYHDSRAGWRCFNHRRGFGDQLSSEDLQGPVEVGATATIGGFRTSSLARIQVGRITTAQ